MLLEHGAEADLVTKSERRSALHLACLDGRPDVVQLLLDHSCTELRDIYGCTPLHLATQRDFSAIVALLMQNKADIKAQSKDGWTSLHLAASLGEYLLYDTCSVELSNGILRSLLQQYFKPQCDK